ncbi:MAG: YceI family protein [Phenylobacterium sp.]|jgi:polyisoprenoid-binding protein YceI|uniref:YceI family protein n=1 Tax=Phenylobacterium sp. TaxID=1871053 RepID=UPI002A2EF61B|nr:YceI family protein [Phenylobacterium sp.]MDD3837617.1 YceI family protein [Phenylobacterium sp.]MDX9997310.1 YceI family protein [Phenylobacterium sp.]
MRPILALCAATALAACSQPAPERPAQTAASPGAEAPPVDAPAGAYKLDLGHSSLIFRVNHLGLSNYTAKFTDFDAELQLDPAQPERSSIVVTIDPASIRTDYPDPKLDFDAMLRGGDFLATDAHPQMTYRSTAVERTGPRTAKINGDLTFRGVTKPVVLEATFNGGYPAGGLDPSGARIGFSARGQLKRSDFGMNTGIPAPGSQMGVGDDVEIVIETEFTQPAPGAAPPAGG